MKTAKIKPKNDDKSVSALVVVLVLALASGLTLALALVFSSGVFVILGFALTMVLILAVVDENVERHANLFLIFLIFFLSGLVLGAIIVQINNLPSNTTTITANCKGTTTCTIATTTVPQSPIYEGIIQAIYQNNPSFVEFTSGEYWYGNLSKITNLSIGADCTLLQNTKQIYVASNEDGFTSGACK